METSLYDTLMTTIVFGIFVDYQIVEAEKAVIRRLASDKICLFQHQNKMGPKKCHFVSRDRASIRARAAEEPNGANLQEYLRELESVYELHCSHNHENSLPPVVTGDLTSDETEAPEDKRKRRTSTFETPGKAPTPEELCRDLSIICSFFDWEGIPQQLVHEAFYQRSLAMYDSLLKPTNLFGKGDRYWEIQKMEDGTKNRDEAIRHLLRDGFFEQVQGGAFYRMSQDRVTALHSHTDQKVLLQWLEYAVRSIDAMLPEDRPPAGWPIHDLLLHTSR